MARRFIFIIVIAAIAIGAIVFRDRLGSDPNDLKVGDCFDSPTAIGETITNVQHHPCSEAHTAEVFAVIKNPTPDNAAYPSDDDVQTFIATVCTQPFNDYVGTTITASALDVRFFEPTTETWNSGDRSFTCYVSHSDDSPFTASVKGTKQ